LPPLADEIEDIESRSIMLKVCLITTGSPTVPKNALRFRYPATNPIRESCEMSRRPWTKDEQERACDMRAAGDSYVEIDRALGRRGRQACWMNF
jgi:hypothetical protein